VCSCRLSVAKDGGVIPRVDEALWIRFILTFEKSSVGARFPRVAPPILAISWRGRNQVKL